MNILLLFSCVVMCGTLSMPGKKKSARQATASNQIGNIERRRHDIDLATFTRTGRGSQSEWIAQNPGLAKKLGLLAADAPQDAFVTPLPAVSRVSVDNMLVAEYLTRDPNTVIATLGWEKQLELLTAFLDCGIQDDPEIERWTALLMNALSTTEQDNSEQSACAAASSDVGLAQVARDASVVSGASTAQEGMTSISQAGSASSMPSSRGSKARFKGTKVDLRALLVSNTAKSDKGSDVAARLAKDAAAAEAKKKREL